MKNLIFIVSVALLLASCKEFEIAASDVPKD